MIYRIVASAAWLGALISVVALRSPRVDNRARGPHRAGGADPHRCRALPPGDGASISDWFFELGLD